MGWEWLAGMVGTAALLLVLYRLGLLNTHAGFRIGGDWGGPRRWEGRYRSFSGMASRRFVPRVGDRLRIRVEAEEGSLDVEVRDREGGLLAAWYGTATLDAPVDLRGAARCAVRLRTAGFRGQFLIALEETGLVFLDKPGPV